MVSQSISVVMRGMAACFARRNSAVLKWQQGEGGRGGKRTTGEDMSVCACGVLRQRGVAVSCGQAMPLPCLKKRSSRALFSFENVKVFGTIALSFVCDKYYLIMD